MFNFLNRFLPYAFHRDQVFLDLCEQLLDRYEMMLYLVDHQDTTETMKEFMAMRPLPNLTEQYVNELNRITGLVVVWDKKSLTKQRARLQAYLAGCGRKVAF